MRPFDRGCHVFRQNFRVNMTCSIMMKGESYLNVFGFFWRQVGCCVCFRKSMMSNNFCSIIWIIRHFGIRNKSGDPAGCAGSSCCRETIRFILLAHYRFWLFKCFWCSIFCLLCAAALSSSDHRFKRDILCIQLPFLVGMWQNWKTSHLNFSSV